MRSKVDATYADIVDVVRQQLGVDVVNYNSVKVTSVVTRSDGHIFFLIAFRRNGRTAWHIKAGCRWRTIKQYRGHLRYYASKNKRAETKAILDLFERQIKLDYSH